MLGGKTILLPNTNINARNEDTRGAPSKAVHYCRVAMTLGAVSPSSLVLKPYGCLRPKEPTIYYGRIFDLKATMVINKQEVAVIEVWCNKISLCFGRLPLISVRIMSCCSCKKNWSGLS